MNGPLGPMATLCPRPLMALGEEEDSGATGNELGLPNQPTTLGCVTLGHGVSLSEPQFPPLMRALRRPMPQGPLGSSDPHVNGWGVINVWLLVIIYVFVFQ